MRWKAILMCRADDPRIKDPGGETLDLVLERGKGQRLDVARFLRIAVGLTKAIGAVQPRTCIGIGTMNGVHQREHLRFRSRRDWWLSRGGIIAGRT
jgi:hypothetical protein